MASSRHFGADAAHPNWGQAETRPTDTAGVTEPITTTTSALDDFPAESSLCDDSHEAAITLLESMLAGRPAPPIRQKRLTLHRCSSIVQSAVRRAGGATLGLGVALARFPGRPAARAVRAVRRVRLTPQLTTALLLIATGAGLIPLATHQPQRVSATSVANLQSAASERAWAPHATPVAASLPALLPAARDDTPLETTSPVTAVTPDLVTDRQSQRAIQGVLNRYRDAFSILDATAVKRIWPTADQRAIQDRFAALDDQNLDFDSCGISVSPPDAVAVCSGILSSRPMGASGPARIEPTQWRFTLSGAGDRWNITRVTERARQD